MIYIEVMHAMHGLNTFLVIKYFMFDSNEKVRFFDES